MENYPFSKFIGFSRISTTQDYFGHVHLATHISITKLTYYVIYRLMDFFPPKKQTEEYLKSVFIEKGLAEVVKLHKAQASYEAKRELTQVKKQKLSFNYNELCVAL